MSSITQKLRKELKALSDEKTCSTAQRFFKEKINCYGVKMPVVSKIAKKYWKEVGALSKAEIFSLCEELYSSGYIEEDFVVSSWLPSMVYRLDREDLIVFRCWIDHYIQNWAACDSLCNHTIGSLIEKYPDLLPDIRLWANSENRWLKRASAVSLVLPVRRGKFLEAVFQICDELLNDPDDLVQKGYGWLLKEASRRHQMDVLYYIMKNKKTMPRTALRYAIELMPNELRKEAMKKD
jgi:3-methyladenine DNA glycosylase AlkD